jgi:RND family efflux transporter MFP subunit
MKSYFLKSIAAVLGASFAFFYGCSDQNPLKENNPVVKVKIETIEESDAVSKLDYVGIIEERSSTALGFSTMGTVEKIFVSEGDFVRKGQMLAKLDQSPARSMLEAAEATLKQAQDAYDRLKSIYEKGSLPEIQMVEIETKLQQAQSSHDLAKKNFDNCTLYAPADGVIGKKMAETGEYFITGTSILTILDISSVKARFSVPENEISRISPDCISEITVAALGNKKFRGKRIEKSVVANSISHTYPAYIIISAPEKNLLPGMVCRVELTPSDKPQGIVVPIGIIQTTSDGQKFIWTEKEGMAKRKFVSTGITRGNGVEILSGLSSGDRIITQGYHKISEDAKIAGK